MILIKLTQCGFLSGKKLEQQLCVTYIERLNGTWEIKVNVPQ